MDHYGHDGDLTNTYGFGISVDDILAEFQLDPVPEPEEERPAAKAPEPVFAPVYGSGPRFDPSLYEPAQTAPASPDLDGDGVRVYQPKSALSAMEDEARAYVAGLAAAGFDGLREEAAYDTRSAGEEGARPEEEEEAAPPRRRGEKRREKSGGLAGRLGVVLGGLKAPGVSSRRAGGRSAPEPEEAGFEEEPDYGEEPGPGYDSPADPAPEEISYVPEEAPGTAYDPGPEPDYSAAHFWDEGRYGWLDGLSAGTEPSEPVSGRSAVALEEPFAPEEPETAAPEEASSFPDAYKHMFYGDREPDLSPDGTDTPPAPEPAPYEAEEEPEEERPARRVEKRAKKRGRKKEKRPLNAPASYGDAYSDLDGGADSYAPAGDYGLPEDEEFIPTAFPSFKDYLASLVNGFLLRMRGFTGGDSTSTMVVDHREDLGQEVSPAAASKYYGSFVHSLRLRLRIALALLLIMSYLSLGLPVPGMLQSVRVASGLCLATQLTILLLGLDVVTGAVMNLGRRRLGADGMAVLACLLTSVDALAVSQDLFGSLHRPLCALSSLSFCAVMLSSLLSARGLRKSLRVPAIGKRIYSVTGETGIKGRARDITLLKTPRPAAGFVRRSEEAAPDETVFIRFSPLFLAGALVLSLIAAATTKQLSDLLYLLTAILSPAVPVTALLSFALPFFIGSMRIFGSGAAIAGWSGLCDIGQSRNLIVTDRDLFPEGSVELESVRIFADEDAEKVISYAGTMMVASGCGVAHCFAELMEKHNCSMRQVESFELLSGGGMQGVIEGETVLCGSSDLMRLMNVRIPFRLVEKTSVLLAIDGILYGIFNMSYTPQPAVRKALVSLMRSNRHPVFAIRDFNVTPEMLHNSFDLATDGYDFPPYVERFAISEAEPSAKSQIAAVVCREGLGPMTHMADTGRSMYITVRINLLLTLLSAVAGMLTVFIKLVAGGTVGAGFLLLFMLAWALPVAVLSLFLKF